MQSLYSFYIIISWNDFEIEKKGRVVGIEKYPENTSMLQCKIIYNWQPNVKI